MKPTEDGVTLIVAGKWNRYILSVEWLAKNIFRADDIQVEFSLNLDLPPRFLKDNVRIVATNSRIVFTALKYQDSVLSSIEQMAQRLATLLPVTPVTAFGINFAYRETAAPPSLIELFSFEDNARLADHGIAIQTSEIKRKVTLDDHIVNLSIRQESGVIGLDFNFHTDIGALEQLPPLLEGRFVRNKNVAERLMKDVYGLALEALEE